MPRTNHDSVISSPATDPAEGASLQATHRTVASLAGALLLAALLVMPSVVAFTQMNEAGFPSRMGRLFAILIVVSLFTLLVALLFLYAIHQQTKHRTKDLAQLETLRLLGKQEEANRQLQLANVTLQERQEKLSVTLNSIDEAVIVTDAKGVIQSFNVGAERMLGYAAVDVMNKITPADLADPKEVSERANTLSLELDTAIQPGFEALVFKASRGIGDSYELTHVRKDGSRFPAVVSVTALRDTQDAILGYLVVGTDNTTFKLGEAERTLLNDALQAKNAELMGAKIVAEQANLAKSEFLSSMSHELRSPLNAILGFAQLLDSASPPATETQKASIDQILHAGWSLLELINEILDLSVVESGTPSLSEEPVSLADVLVDCQAMIEPQALKRGLKMAFSRINGPSYVRADRVRLKQVLVNLLSNAIKYNRPGGTVVVDCTTNTPGRLRISVRDTGHGLPPEKLRQLFQPFNRLGQEHSAEPGTGIGLVMSKLLVELMGGAIGVESTVGVGSLFWCELNSVATPQLANDQSDSTLTLQVPIPSGAPPHTLLYVEDNLANLNLVEQLIERRPNMHLLSAWNGTLGIKMARAKQPDVILMDINLPGISGLQALKRLHTDPSTAHIPVVAISANSMLKDIRKGLDAGFFRYLTKPINVTEFMQTINLALEFAGKHPRIGSKELQST